MSQAMSQIIPEEVIASKIHFIRGQKVMLDSDLAELYGIPTGRLNEAVKRNLDRFPEDFMFQMNEEELENWRSQIAISNPASKMGLRRAPYVFTEHDTLMLSSVLKSQKSIEINILIIRTFVKLREILATHQDVANKIKEHDQHIANLYGHLERILKLDPTNKNQIGYIWDEDQDQK